jgi:ERCC4-related helicase
MNNSKLTMENVPLSEEKAADFTPYLRQQETELVEVIEALEAIKGSKYWKLLEERVFKGVHESLHRKMRNEKDSKELFRLQGQLIWADKYADLGNLIEANKKILQRVKQELAKVNS